MRYLGQLAVPLHDVLDASRLHHEGEAALLLLHLLHSLNTEESFLSPQSSLSSVPKLTSALDLTMTLSRFSGELMNDHIFMYVLRRIPEIK